MKAWGAICLISLGGLVEAAMGGGGHDAPLWGTLLGVSALGWSWTAICTVVVQFLDAVTGRRKALPRTNPQALAAEMAALNAQIAQLRDTATSFDVSFDHTLQTLDERLRRIEQQTTYVQPTVPLGRGR
jgi:hypothetical protein